jgi:DNA repair protein RecN (Recombination protein N)
MLTNLTITNFALVQRLDLTFFEGMSVVTGETGAGKSIMLDALGLTLGDRADNNLLGLQGDKAEILSCFDVSNLKAAADWLIDRELATEDTVVIMRRVINRDGRSRGFINGIPTTLADMKVLGNLLIDIHSQHEHQSLLKKETHRRLLDEYGHLLKDASSVKTLFDNYKSCKDRLEKLLTDNAEQSSRFQLLTYQSSELNELNLLEGETGKLELEQKRLANAEGVLQQCQEAISLCNSDEGSSAITAITKAVAYLNEIEDTQIRPILELMSSGLIQIEEATSDLEHYSQNYEIDPGKLTQVEERLSKVYEIARKHRIDPSQIPALNDSIKAELKAIDNMDVEVEELTIELDSLKSRYQKLASKLARARKKTAKKLSAEVTTKLAELGMAGAEFVIELTDIAAGTLTANGLEDIEFLISTNAGHSPGPLNKIASGGELSRISLAIQVATANTSSVPTLVFDEVDVGIGGATAEVVGRLLRELGKQAQIICVTHLPQVASQGNQHLKVIKEGQDLAVETTVVTLDEAERVDEIARMLGGISVTDQSLAHAQEMFASAQK